MTSMINYKICQDWKGIICYLNNKCCDWLKSLLLRTEMELITSVLESRGIYLPVVPRVHGDLTTEVSIGKGMVGTWNASPSYTNPTLIFLLQYSLLIIYKCHRLSKLMRLLYHITVFNTFTFLISDNRS